jgi:MFS family permease
MTDRTLYSKRLAALQHRDFRLLWAGQFVSTIGSQMQLAAVDWHVYQLLRGQTYTLHIFGWNLPLGAEALGLGGLGLVRIIPIVLFALLGGLIADSVDRRKIMLFTQSLAAVLAGVLAALTLAGRDSIPAIYLLTSALSAAAAFDSPARQSLIPNLVPREHMTNAVSLNTLNWQIGTIAGPMIAGLLIGTTNIGLVYGINALTFVAVIAALAVMQYRRPVTAPSGGLGWHALVEGLRFTYRSRIIWGTMLLDFFATFFSSANTMLPLVAGNILGVGAFGYGMLRTAQPLGAVIASIITALRRDIERQGVVLLVSVALYGAATAIFGVSKLFFLSYLMLAGTGAADTVSMVIRNTLRQILTPDHLRGRMTSVNMMFFMGGPQLGELEAGLVASIFGVPFAILSGGLATVVMAAVIAWRYPRLRQYTSATRDAEAQAA